MEVTGETFCVKKMTVTQLISDDWDAIIIAFTEEKW